MTDTGNRPEGDNADSPDALEGNWPKKYDGLQRVLGQRTNELAEARQIAQEAAARAEAAERAAATYRELYEALYAPPEPDAPPPAPSPVADPDDDDLVLDANSPRRHVSPAPRKPTSASDWFAELGKYPSSAFGRD